RIAGRVNESQLLAVACLEYSAQDSRGMLANRRLATQCKIVAFDDCLWRWKHEQALTEKRERLRPSVSLGAGVGLGSSPVVKDASVMHCGGLPTTRDYP